MKYAKKIIEIINNDKAVLMAYFVARFCVNGFLK
jgi:hypothetical protein